MVVLLFVTFCGCKKDSTPVPTVTISSVPVNVEYGNTAVVSWSSTNASSCTIDGKDVGISGSFTTPALTSNITYSITAIGNGGTVNSSLAIGVGPGMTLSFKDTTIVYGANLTLSWTANNAISCQIQGKSSPSSGSIEMKTLIRNTTLTILVNGVGSISKTASVKVGDWTSSKLGLLTHQPCMFKKINLIQNEQIIAWLDLAPEQLNLKTYYYINKDLILWKGTTFEGFNDGVVTSNGPWSFLDNKTRFLRGDQTFLILSLTKNEFILRTEEPRTYNGIPVKYDHIAWRP